MKLQNLRVESQHRLILSLSAGIVLLICLLVVVVVNQRKKKKLYENLVTQNRKNVALRDEILSNPSTVPSVLTVMEDFREKDLNAVAIQTDGLNDEESALESSEEVSDTQFLLSDKKAEELYAALCRLMKEERLFTDMRLTRESVIERLGTNRTYLTQVISRYGWSNYSHFVNSFRIDEAIRILSDKTRGEIKMRDLYLELGFGSQTTFYKTFSAATGMSPAVFRKSVK